MAAGKFQSARQGRGRQAVDGQAHGEVAGIWVLEPAHAAQAARALEHHEDLSSPAASGFVRPKVPPVSAAREDHRLRPRLRRVQKVHEPLPHQQADRIAVGNPVLIDEAGVIGPLLLERKGTQRQVVIDLKRAVELVGNIIAQVGASREKRDIIEARRAALRFVAKSSPADVQRPQAQADDGFLPGGLDRPGIGLSRQTYDLSGVIGVHRVPLPDQSLEDVESNRGHA